MVLWRWRVTQARYEARERSLVEGVHIPEPLYQDLQALLK